MSDDGQNPDWDEHAQNTKLTENQPGTPTDTALQSEVWLVFWQAEDQAELDTSQLEVMVRKCDVWLSGEVGNERERHLAECLARSLDGVETCHNELITRSAK